MKRYVLSLVLVGALLLVSVPLTASAQHPPAIIDFTSSLDGITVAEAEAGETTATLGWATVGVTGDYRLRLHFYLENRWVPVFDEASVPLDPSGEREVTVQHPMNFGPPTYLLSLVDGQQRVIDQRPLTIPYVGEDAPVVESFAAEVTEVSAADLMAGTARVELMWTVTNRAPHSNPVFEQVFDDGTSQLIELPRPNLWIPSDAHGPVAPVWRDGMSAVQVRMQLVDLATGEVYAEEVLELPVTGAPGAAETLSQPTVDPNQAAFPTAAPPDASQPDANQTVFPTAAPPVSGAAPTTFNPQIASFSVTPTTVNPGAAVRLAWEVLGTGGVTIEQRVPGIELLQTVVSAQSPQGSATVYIPDLAAYSVEYTLWTADRSAAAHTVVAVHCPFTFFFGAAIGCPSTAPLQVPAAYEPFEGGFMIWRGDTNEVYVYYEDGGDQGGAAAYFLEASYANLPEARPGESPPLDRYAPVSGFGRVWANAPGVADRLGWALAPESGYTTQLQQVAMARIPPPEFSFFLTLPDGRVIGSGAGHWRYMT
ncbi:MAG: hypothetical protein GXY36_13315 [Chloroflexi bacterium]|nr:hypothetical protein [Chloroflexota bacterium]